MPFRSCGTRNGPNDGAPSEANCPHTPQRLLGEADPVRDCSLPTGHLNGHFSTNFNFDVPQPASDLGPGRKRLNEGMSQTVNYSIWCGLVQSIFRLNVPSAGDLDSSKMLQQVSCAALRIADSRRDELEPTEQPAL